MKKIALALALTLVSQTSAATDFYCRYVMYGKNTSPHHLIRLDMENLSGTHYFTKQDVDNKIVNVSESPFTDVIVYDLEVWMPIGYWGRGVRLNRQTLKLGSGGMKGQCEIITDLDDRLANFRAEAEQTVPRTQF